MANRHQSRAFSLSEALEAAGRTWKERESNRESTEEDPWTALYHYNSAFPQETALSDRPPSEYDDFVAASIAVRKAEAEVRPQSRRSTIHPGRSIAHAHDSDHLSRISASPILVDAPQPSAAHYEPARFGHSRPDVMYTGQIHGTKRRKIAVSEGEAPSRLSLSHHNDRGDVVHGYHRSFSTAGQIHTTDASHLPTPRPSPLYGNRRPNRTPREIIPKEEVSTAIQLDINHMSMADRPSSYMHGQAEQPGRYPSRYEHPMAQSEMAVQRNLSWTQPLPDPIQHWQSSFHGWHGDIRPGTKLPNSKATWFKQ